MYSPEALNSSIFYTCTLADIHSEHGRNLAMVDLKASFVQSAGDRVGAGPLGLSLKLKEGSLTGRAEFDAARGEYTDIRTQADVLLDLTYSPQEKLTAPLGAQVHVDQRTLALTSAERNKQKRERGVKLRR